ncbi:MAG: M48 family metallopeptidase [Candidatus Omnitrophica bacterium]|nr:M48 family metallopeptidase [Candidatus Omnitrophota bacterium]
MNKYLVLILGIILFKYLLNLIVEILNIKYVNPRLPEELIGYYEAEKYKKSQLYLKEKTNFSLIEDTLMTVITVGFILYGGFNLVDGIARGFGYGTIISGLIFLGILMLASQILNIPFSVYQTFVIEQKYGFNKTTIKTFIADIVKGMLIGALIGGIAFAGILWFFEKTSSLAWLYCWTALTVFQLFLMFIAPVVIMPLFNKFIPLEDGALKQTLEKYARTQNFKMQGVFTMDGSRRSTKSNAFFTGFGKFRRIALFDTLIAKHTTDELVSVLAHEIGHYKKKHILKSIFISIATTGLMFFVLSFFLNNPGVFAAFKMKHTSIYASLVFFGFVYAPINMLFSIVGSILSRKHEYEADRFAVETYKKPDAFIDALKKLTVDNLSNLTPHPAKVFLAYSHPPVLLRIKAIRNYAK